MKVLKISATLTFTSAINDGHLKLDRDELPLAHPGDSWSAQYTVFPADGQTHFPVDLRLTGAPGPFTLTLKLPGATQPFYTLPDAIDGTTIYEDTKQAPVP